MRTKFTEMTGAKVPIMCGGMHHVAKEEWCLNVCKTGALGCLTALSYDSPAELGKAIRWVQERTDNAFAVNLTLLPMLATVDYGEFVKVIVENKVKVVETAGNAAGDVIAPLRKAGIVVIHKCTKIRHALAAVRVGASIISVDGFECAGHPGTNTASTSLLLCDALKKLNVPYIASGGVQTGAQMAAAICQGAVGVNMCTRFMVTKESPILPDIKKALIDAGVDDTVIIFSTLNNHERVFKNKTSLEVVELEKKYPGDFSKIQHLVKGLKYKESFFETGDTQSSCWSCSQGIHLIEDEPSMQELVERMQSECQDSFKRLQSAL